MATNELPSRGNKRGGPGWWMDLDGVWRAPEEWPEDTPPLDGWLRSSDGGWHAPTVATAERDEPARQAVAVVDDHAPEVVDDDGQPRRSRQAEADRKAMFTVAGVIAAGLMILVAVLVLITQAGAEDIPEAETANEDSVVFAAETDEVRMQRRLAAAADAPATARARLALLDVRSAPDEDMLDGYDLLEWTAERTDCLDIAEQILVDRSLTPIQWADQLECVPDSGRWVDRYLGSTITRTLDADVTLHVPSAVAYVSGGADWTPATRQAYLTDVDHPASLEITSAGSGHNPRGHDPSLWKPSAQSSWCAYAIDWIAVKDRWNMSVTGVEQASLSEMLESCADASSAGPDLYTMVIDDLAPATIERIEGAAE